MMRQDWVGTYLRTSLASWFDAPGDEQGLFVESLGLAMWSQRPGRRRRRRGGAAVGSCVMILIILGEHQHNFFLLSLVVGLSR